MSFKDWTSFQSISSDSSHLSDESSFNILNKLLENRDLSSVEDLDIYKLRRAIVYIKDDIWHQLQSETSLNSSLKHNIFQDFCRFTSSIGNQKDISYQEFWKMISNRSTEIHFVSFLKLYIDQIAIVFFLKQKFLIHYSQKSHTKLYPAYYSNINSLYSKLFSTTKFSDFKLRSFQISAYSWYLPNIHLVNKIQNLGLMLINISISTFLDFLQKSLSISKTDSFYRDFLPTLSKSISLKVYDDHLLTKSNMMSLLRGFYKNKILYSSHESRFHIFYLLHELLFCINLISDEKVSIEDFHKTTRSTGRLSHNFFSSTYRECLIFRDLSLTSVKSFINQQDFHQMYFVTQKTFFKPAKKQKTQKILNNLTIKEHISFEDQENFNIYIFHKKDSSKKDYKPSHKHFRIQHSVQNKNYQLVSQKIRLLQDKVFEQKTMVNSQKYINFRIDYFHDIVNDGVLLSSGEKQQSLTHPRFFQALTRKCVPLDLFFKVSPIKKELLSPTPMPLLQNQQILPPYVLIIQTPYAQNYQVSLDIIPGESYLGYLKDHGSFENQYFALIPKVPEMNISLLRFFFKTRLGQQITQLCFRGNNHYRTKLKTLLIPKFLGDLETSSPSLRKSLSPFMSYIPDQEPSINLPEKLESLSFLLSEQFKRHPLYTLSKLQAFSIKLSQYLGKTQHKGLFYIDFYLPQLITEIKSLKTFPINSKHQDIFLDYHINKDQIHLKITHFKFDYPDELNENYRIHIYNDQTLMTSIYTKKYLCEFIKFLLNHMNDFSLSQVVQSLNLPRENDLRSILSHYEVDHSIFYDLTKKCDTIVEEFFQKYILD